MRCPSTLVPLLAALIAATPLQAAEPPAALDAGARRIATLRPVAVEVPQARIETSVDVGRVPADPASGLIDALVVGSLDHKAAILAARASDRADAAVEPLVAAVADFAVEPLALATTRRALGASDWFGADVVTLVPGPEGASVNQFAAAHPSQQLGLVTYRYRTSPDFTQIQVAATVTIANAADFAPLSSLTVISAVRLADRAFEPQANVARWSEDGGRRARAALEAAFARLGTVLPGVLALDKAGFAAATDKRRESALVGGSYGPVVLRDDGGAVIWSARDKAFVAVQPTAD